MKNYYRNKVVVITGAGSGMGRAYAQAFAKVGARLALNDYNTQALIETRQLLSNISDHDILTQAFDVSDASKMQSFADAVQQHFSGADIVINNAGVASRAAPAWELSLAEFDKIMGINFNGVLNGCQAFLPQLIQKGRGHIVNVSSIFGLVGTPNHTAYCASKYAVRGYTEALMTELVNSNIKVHLLHPGGIDTNISNNLEGTNAFAQQYLTTSPDDIAKYLLKEIPRGTLRMVYGQDSFKTWLGATVLPLNILNKVIWFEMKKVLDLKQYQKVAKK